MSHTYFITDFDSEDHQADPFPVVSGFEPELRAAILSAGAHAESSGHEHGVVRVHLSVFSDEPNKLVCIVPPPEDMD